MKPEPWNVGRLWLGRFFFFLTLATVLLSGWGVYTLHSSPSLSFSSHYWLSLADPELRQINGIDIDPTVSLRLPEFFTPAAEASWWQFQRRLHDLLTTHDTITLSFVDRDGALRTKEARVSELPLWVVFKRTWLIYLVVGICLSSALSVFQRHHSTAGTVLAFFLLACGMYFACAAPLVSRTLTLSPLAFLLFAVVLHTAAGGLVTFAHFAMIFPEPKPLLKRYPWVQYLPYLSFFSATFCYLFRIAAFGSTFPLLAGWVVFISWAFLYSLWTEPDPFLRRQIWLSLLAPVLVSLFFVGLYVLPGVLRLTPVDFRYFALIFLLLPFALPLALDNLTLYHVRLDIERTAQQEKEHIRADLHDLILNNLAVISRASEVARSQLHKESRTVERRLQTIQDLASGTSRQLREFLWVLDDQHNNWEELCGRLRQWGHECLEDAGCEFELDVAPAVFSLPFPPLRLRVCFDRVYKEALLNVVKHAEAKRVHASLFCRGTTLICAVEDDGAGFDVSAKLNGDHYGLKNMQRRIEEVGGRFLIFSEDGLGTRLTVELPLA